MDDISGWNFDGYIYGGVMAGSLAIDNVTVTDTSTHAKEVKGSKCLLLFTHNMSFSAPVNLFAGQVQTKNTSPFKGMVMPRAGSITGISVIYNLTAQSAPPPAVQARIEGATAINELLNTTIANGKTHNFTQARGVDPFSAGESVYARIIGGHTLDTVIVCIEIMLDD